MAKKVQSKEVQKLTLNDVLKGNFLNREGFQKHFKFICLLFTLMLMMIYSSHLVSKKIKVINALKEQTEEYKSRNAYAQSKLIKIRLESELGKEMMSDSLLSLESHPHKILIQTP